MIYQKKGELMKTEEGLALVNSKRQAYRVDAAVAIIWTLCDGKNSNTAISDKLIEESKAAPQAQKDPEAFAKAIRQSVDDVLGKLAELGFVAKAGSSKPAKARSKAKPAPKPKPKPKTPAKKAGKPKKR